MKLQMLKQAMIAYVTNSVKVIWSVVTHPLTIVGKKNCDVADYRIHGNSVQDGTPTYKAPKEIRSVGELVTEGEHTGKYRISVKISSGTKTKTVELYVSEPLRKVGKYADVLDFANQRVIRHVTSEYITAVDSKSSTERTYSMFLSNLTKKPKYESDVAHCIASKFKPGEYIYTLIATRPNIIQTYITNAGVNRIAYTFDGIYTLAEAQELIGDGFDVCYVLATPTEEEIELPTLPQFNGTTTYEVLTDAPPSGIEVQYF